MHTTFKEDIMRALIYRKLNFDLLDWFDYGLISSVSYTADGGHANIELFAQYEDTMIGDFDYSKVDELVLFLENKGWDVDSEEFAICVELKMSPGTSDTEKRTYAETGDYDREETEDA